MLSVVGFTMAQRTVSGTVTDNSGIPLIGANVQAKGTTVGTITDIDGNYSLSVPSETTVLVFSYTGYNTREVSLGESNTVNVELAEGVELSEVVVTGLGIKKEKKALGYGVTTIGESQVEGRTEADVARILRGKAPGVDITQTSGIAGSGTNVIIRGYSSITGSNQPLFVVDGVPFNTDTNNDQNFLTGGATASSRFLDLDPNNISEISILKGLSATVLYGEAGRNGVVLITTKNGAVGGDADKGFEVTLTQNVSQVEVANLPDYQNSFGNGFSGNFGWFFSNWGPSFDTRGSNGIDENGQVEHPYDQAQYNDDFPEFIGARYDYKPYESVEQFFQKGLSRNTSVNMEKNFGDAAISANFSTLKDEGFTEGNVYNRINFGLGGTAKLANGLNVRASFNYTDSDRTAPPASVGYGSNPEGASVFANVLYTPRSIDLFGLPYQSPLDGSMVYYRRGSAIQNPRWTLDNANDFEDVKRFFGTITLDYQILDWLTATYRVGVDQYTQQNRRSINKGGSQVPNGQYRSTETINNITDQILNFAASYRINDDFEIDGLVGLNLREQNNDYTWLNSTDQFVYGLFTHNNFTEHDGFSRYTIENTIGAYFTASLGYKSYLYLNVQGRNDWTSTLEPENRSIFYPSASVSFIPTEAISSLQNNSVINYLKLRVGYGTSAGFPSPYQTRTTLATRTNVFVTSGGTILNTNSNYNNNNGVARLGNPNLTAEVLKELEFGVEARFLDNRVGVDLSYYNKQSSDLIIDLDLDPSTGFTNTTVNAAELENKGIELGLNLVPVRGDFTWDIQANYTRNRNIINKIADGVDQIPIAGFTNLGNFAIEGEPYGIMQGVPFDKLEGTDDIIVNSIGEYEIQSGIAPIGDPNPDWTGNLINTFSYKSFSIRGQLSYQAGGDIYSVTTATMLARGNTVDTDVDRYIPVILPGVLADGTPNNIQVYLGDAMFAGYFAADEGAVFDATNLRLREVAISYALPASILDGSPFGSASVSFTGENLWYKSYNFPEGVNFDPEVLSLGVGNGRGFDFLTGPTAKKYGVNLSVTF